MHHNNNIALIPRLIFFLIILSTPLYAKQSEAGKLLTKFLEENKGQNIVEIPKELKNLKVKYLFRFSSKPPLPTKGDEDVFIFFFKGDKFNYRYLFSVDKRRWDRTKSYSFEEVLKGKKIVEYTVHKIQGSEIKLISSHLKKQVPHIELR